MTQLNPYKLTIEEGLDLTLSTRYTKYEDVIAREIIISGANPLLTCPREWALEAVEKAGYPEWMFNKDSLNSHSFAVHVRSVLDSNASLAVLELLGDQRGPQENRIRHELRENMVGEYMTGLLKSEMSQEIYEQFMLDHNVFIHPERIKEWHKEDDE